MGDGQVDPVTGKTVLNIREDFDIWRSVGCGFKSQFQGMFPEG